MRLVNCSSLQLEEFLGTNILDYAILSHRWEEEKVSFVDFIRNQAAAKDKRSFRKIFLTCRQALAEGFGYAWVDTCCIRNVAQMIMPYESGGCRRQER
jgi:hypothetical protein